MKLVRRMKLHRLASAIRAMMKATIRAARSPGVSIARTNSHKAAAKVMVRHASPNSNRRLKPMLFHAPVERAAAEAELPGGERDVEMVHPQRPLEHLMCELVEVEAGRGFGRGDARRFRTRGQGKVLGPVMLAVGH